MNTNTDSFERILNYKIKTLFYEKKGEWKLFNNVYFLNFYEKVEGVKKDKSSFDDTKDDI